MSVFVILQSRWAWTCGHFWKRPVFPRCTLDERLGFITPRSDGSSPCQRAVEFAPLHVINITRLLLTDWFIFLGRSCFKWTRKKKKQRKFRRQGLRDRDILESRNHPNPLSLSLSRRWIQRWLVAHIMRRIVLSLLWKIGLSSLISDRDNSVALL